MRDFNTGGPVRADKPDCVRPLGRTTLGRLLLAVLASVSAALWTFACGDGTTEPGSYVAEPATVTVSPATAELSAFGATVQLSAEVWEQNGLVMAEATVAWTSSDGSVVIVDGSGLVTATGNGVATVTATAGSASGTATVTVTQPGAAGISVYPPSLTPAEAGKQGRDTIRVTVTDAAGRPVADASYRWDNDQYSGWVFPAEGRTSATGVISGTWVAGWPGNRRLRLTVEDSVLHLTAEIIVRSVTSANRPTGALNLGIDHVGGAGYSIDITPMTEPPGTYYAAINWDGGYAGLQRAGSRYDRQLQFSVWDAPDFGDAQVVERGEGVLCRTFGGEGTGQACELEYPWSVGSTYRFEVTERGMDGGSAMTLHVTDIASGERRFVGTLRFARPVLMRWPTVFVEDFRPAADHCLAREVRSVVVRRAMALMGGEWQPMTMGVLGKPSTDYGNPGTPGCANVAGRSHPLGLELVIGGNAVTDPNGPTRVTIPN